MSTTTPRLNLPYLAAGQAQKHVTVNDALDRLDELAHLSVVEERSSPPASPAEGKRYVIGATPTGAWAGQSGQIAIVDDGAWRFVTPSEGWVCWFEQLGAMRVFHNGGWMHLPAGQQSNLFGINTNADTTNRLAVASAGSLFTHVDGSHRMAINRAAVPDTASVLFETGYAASTEIGLAGGTDFVLRVSDNGTDWRTALAMDTLTGQITTPLTDSAGPFANLLVNGDFRVNQRNFAGGALALNAYGYDRWKAAAANTQVTAGSSGVQVSGALTQTIETTQWTTTNFAGQSLTFCIDSLSGGALTVTLNGQSQTIQPGAGPKSATFTLPSNATGNLTLTMAGSGVSFRRVQMTPGSRLQGWAVRPLSLELGLCQRYFQIIGPSAGGPFAPGMAQTATRWLVPLPLQQSLRADPVVSYSGGSRIYLYSGSNSLVTSVSFSSRSATSITIAADIEASVGNGMGTYYAVTPLPRISLDADFS